MLLPDIWHISGGWYIFQQDSAPAHRARATMDFLEREMPEFISQLLWPPDLNPVDYSVWSILQEKVYKTRITDLDDLKHRIRTEWANLDHDDIAAAAVRQCRRRLSACLRAQAVVISSTAVNSNMFCVNYGL